MKKSLRNKQYLVFTIFFLILLLFNGCTSFVAVSTQKKPNSLPVFPENISPKFEIKKVDFVGHYVVPANKQAINKLKIELSCSKLMYDGIEFYSNLFAKSEKSIPLEIAIDWSMNGSPGAGLLIGIFSAATLPMPVQAKHTIKISLRSKINNIEIIDKNSDIILDVNGWMTIFSPLGLIPYPGKSDFKPEELGHDKFIRKIILWNIIQGIDASDKKIIAALYKNRDYEDRRMLKMITEKITLNDTNKKYCKKDVAKEQIDSTNYETVFALIAGVGVYKNSKLKNLPYADDDANDFANVLKKIGWSDGKIKLLTNQKATKVNIQEALDGWLTKAGKNDLIVLFWSGHGFTDPDDSEKVYLACYDTDPTKPYTGYRMDRVVSAIKEKGAKNVIIIADTCHAGKLVTRGQRGLSISPHIENLRKKEAIPKGWIFMVSAEADRNAIEHSKWSNGAFTYCLLKGLRGEADGFEGIAKKDGIITMRELRAYLSSKMPDETQKVLGIAKHPLITTSSGDSKIWDLSLEKNNSKK